MKRFNAAVIFAMILPFAGAVWADSGELSMDVIDQIQASFQMDPHTRAVYNAVTNNNVSDLALNREILREHNDMFTNRIDVKDITDQKSTGRCWIFASLNMLRYGVIKEHDLKKLELSQNYLAFWDKMEKANVFYERIIEFRKRHPLDRELEIVLKNPCPDGGWWEAAVNLIEKYGVVPKEIMPETNSSEATAAMNKILDKKLRSDAAKLRKMHREGKAEKALRSEKEKMLAEVYKILVLNLGTPPGEFVWRYEGNKKDDDEKDEDKDKNNDAEDKDNTQDIIEVRMTPKKFYDQYVGADLDEYVDIFNDPSKKIGEHYKLKMSTNVQGARDVDFVNARISILKQAAAESVLANDPVWFAADAGKDQSRDDGIMASNLYDYDSIYGIDMSLSKSQQVLYRHGALNHAMVFVGVDMKDEKPVKWLVENSWGKDKGKDGYWTLYDSWFDRHVYGVIVKKKYVPANILKLFDKKPIMLPPWDPQYAGCD